MNWKPAVKVNGADDWSYNALVFETEEEALASANDLRNRWLLVTDAGATPTEDPANYRIDFETHEMIAIEP